MTSEREWEGGRGECFGKARVAASPSLSRAVLEGACIIHKDSAHALPKTFKSLWLIQSVYLLSPKHSAVCFSIERGLNSKSLDKNWFLLLPKNSFFSVFVIGCPSSLPSGDL